MLTFKLIGVYDSKYNFNLDKTTVSEKIIKQIEHLDWNENFDTVILGHVSDLSNASKLNYHQYIRDMCAKHNKNLFQFDSVKNEARIYSSNISTEYIPTPVKLWEFIHSW